MILKLKPADTPSYINAAPSAVQEKLWAMHECILKAAPGATEGLKWGIVVLLNSDKTMQRKGFLKTK